MLKLTDCSHPVDKDQFVHKCLAEKIEGCLDIILDQPNSLTNWMVIHGADKHQTKTFKTLKATQDYLR